MRINALLTFALLLSACGGDRELQVVQEQRVGNLVVSLLADSAEVQQDSNDLVLEFRDASTNELTMVENVRVQATMPMPGMAPMFGDISTPSSETAGRYAFTAGLGMAGGWNFVVTFDPEARVQFNVNAR